MVIIYIKMNEKIKNDIGNHFYYNEEELSLFLENERNQDVFSLSINSFIYYLVGNNNFFK